MPWSSQAILASIILVEGDAGGVFIYDSSGNLIDSIAAQINVDPLTHSNQQGIANYVAGTPLRFVQINSGQITLGAVTSTVRSTISTQNFGGRLVLDTGLTGAGDTSADIKLFSKNGRGSGSPQILMSAGGATSATASFLEVQGDVAAATAGNGFRASEGANGKQGTATLSAGTIVVSNTSVTANRRIFLTAQDNNSTGALRVSARTAATSFTITSSNAADSGVVAYEIFEPA